MKLAHQITISMFLKPEEDRQVGERSFHEFLSFLSPDEQERFIIKKVSKGFHERDILVLSAELTKEKHTSRLLALLKERLSGAQKQQLREQADRLDEQFHFFLRFRKQDLPRLVLTDGGDCLHLKISLAVFPKRRDRALALVEEIFS